VLPRQLADIRRLLAEEPDAAQRWHRQGEDGLGSERLATGVGDEALPDGAAAVPLSCWKTIVRARLSKVGSR
jgi:hypothetical protein